MMGMYVGTVRADNESRTEEDEAGEIVSVCTDRSVCFQGSIIIYTTINYNINSDSYCSMQQIVFRTTAIVSISGREAREPPSKRAHNQNEWHTPMPDVSFSINS